MENASKALIMAGSMLAAMIVIGALVFMFTRVSQVKQGEIDSEEVSQMYENSKKFEQYTGTIYGSELLSLANLYEDLKSKGYERTQITIELNQPIKTDTYLYVDSRDLKIDYLIRKIKIIRV